MKVFNKSEREILNDLSTRIERSLVLVGNAACDDESYAWESKLDEAARLLYQLLQLDNR